MKKFKKVVLLAMSFAMSATLFAACGGSGDNGGSGTDSSVDLSFNDSDLSEDLSDIFGDLSEIIGDSSDIFGDISEIIGESSDIFGDLSEIIGESSDIFGDLSEIIGESSDIFGDLSEIIGESSEVIGESSEIIEESSEIIEESSEIIEDSSEIGDDTSVGGDMELPDVDVEISEPLGEQVADQAEWDAVWEKSCKATNFIVIDECIGPDVDERGVVYVADGKYFSKYTLTNGEMEYAFCGKVAGKDYGWTSSDGIDWTVEELEDLSNYAKGEFIFEEFFAANDFENAVFNENRGTYTIDMFSEEVTFFYEVKIAGGYIVAIDRYYDQEKWCLTIEYGNAGIGELPPLENDGDTPAGGDEDVVGEQVDAETWAQALTDAANTTNATIEYSLKTEGDFGKIFNNAEVKVADGKVYNFEQITTRLDIDGFLMEYNGEAQTYLAMIDGGAKEYYKEDEEDWVTYPFESEMGIEFSATVGFVLNEYLGVDLEELSITYIMFEYDNGAYVCQIVADDDDYTSTMEFKFVDDQLVWGKVAMLNLYDIETETEMDIEVSFTITYGNASVGELPSIENDDDVPADGNQSDDNNGEDGAATVNPGVGEEVTEAEFQQAVQASYAATNLTLVVTDVDGVTTTNIADDKVHNVTVVSGMTVESYVGAVGGVYYQWISVYGNWIYEALDWNQEYSPATGESALSDILCWCEFSCADFNEETGIYTFTNLGAPTVYAMVANGKIVKCGVESEGDDWVKMEIAYGNASVGELPPLE